MSELHSGSLINKFTVTATLGAAVLSGLAGLEENSQANRTDGVAHHSTNLGDTNQAAHFENVADEQRNIRNLELGIAGSTLAVSMLFYSLGKRREAEEELTTLRNRTEN